MADATATTYDSRVPLFLLFPDFTPHFLQREGAAQHAEGAIHGSSGTSKIQNQASNKHNLQSHLLHPLHPPHPQPQPHPQTSNRRTQPAQLCHRATAGRAPRNDTNATSANSNATSTSICSQEKNTLQTQDRNNRIPQIQRRTRTARTDKAEMAPKPGRLRTNRWPRRQQ